RSLQQEDHPDVEIVSEGLRECIGKLREQSGRDIWLYGGGSLFSQLLEWNLVDTFEPAYIPIILGDGVPLIAANSVRRHLTYLRQHVYPSGMILLEYEVAKTKEL